MRAVVLQEKGGPEVLRMLEVPDPEPGPEEVLVDIVSTAVNRADLLQRMGLYPGPPMVHEIPGLEFAGRVVAIGDVHGVGLDELLGLAGFLKALGVHVQRSDAGAPAGPAPGGKAPHAASCPGN